MMNKIGKNAEEIRDIISNNKLSFEELLKNILNIKQISATDIEDDIKEIFNIIFGSKNGVLSNVVKVFLTGDNFFFIIESSRVYESLQKEWHDFALINESIRSTLVEALTEDLENGIFSYIRYVESDINSYMVKKLTKIINSNEISDTSLELIKKIKDFNNNPDKLMMIS